MRIRPRNVTASWGERVFPGAMVVFLVGVLLQGQVGGAGRLEGTARDAAGSVLPGTSITIANAELKQSVVSGQDGRFVFPSVPQGRYTVTASLAGFQTKQQTGVHVTSAHTTRVDVLLPVGCLFSVLYVPGPGLDRLLRDTDLIVHLRVSTISAPREFDFGDGCLGGKQYDATPIQVVAAGPASRAAAQVIRFVFEGGNGSYEPGQEFVAFLERDLRSELLHPVMGSWSLVPVREGRVEWTRTDVPALTDGMPVADFLSVLKSVLPGGRAN
jgi:hypothetical protein